MFKKYIATAVIASNLIGLTAFAQEGAVATEEAQTAQAREALRDTRQDVRANVDTLRKEAQEAAQRARQEVGSQIKDLRGEAKEKREDLRESLKTKREETKKKIEDERAKLKAKLAKLKDERKKNIVEKVAQQIKELNDRLTNHFTDVLEKLGKTLARIEARIKKGEERGMDVSSARRALETANAEIKKAEEAVKLQATKVYPISITTEEELKVDVGAAREALNKDLRVLRDVVQAARNAVQNVATTLAQIPKVEKDKVATTTATTTQQ